MGRKLSGQIMDSVVINVKDKINQYFIGTLTSEAKEVKMRKGKGYVYEFKLEDTDMPTQMKNEDGEYVETPVEEGDTVSVFAPTVLRLALNRSSVGKRIKFVYLGKEEGKGSNDYHNYDVEELDDVNG